MNNYLIKSQKIISIAAIGIGVVILGACTNSDRATNPDNPIAVNTANPTPAESSPASNPKTDSQHGAANGGQVVETGKYHLEFVPAKEAKATHMDLYLQTGDKHETVPDAKVTAQVQSPEGKAQAIAFNYDPKDKHYTGMLSASASGQYQVKITADIKGEKVDARFNFNR
jgi:hypothetical protein